MQTPCSTHKKPPTLVPGESKSTMSRCGKRPITKPTTVMRFGARVSGR
jgi:hypothetical protein